MSWLPYGKCGALCFSIDDVHPATANDPYEAGGDLGAGALGFVERLLQRHPLLRVTLFVTPDWRPVQLVRRRRLARLPLLSSCLYHVDLHPKGRFRIDRHAGFVDYLNDLPRTEVAMHGLHHVHRGPNLAVEFQQQSHRQCARMLATGLEIFSHADLRHARGFSPPGWRLPQSLVMALERFDFAFVTSARDIRTKITPEALNGMSGLPNASIIYPQLVGSTQRLVHIPTNFQATSSPERIREIIACNGLVSVKAHVFKRGGGYTLLDGLGDEYFRYLDRLFSELEDEYGERLWWTSMSEIAARRIEAQPSTDRHAA